MVACDGAVVARTALSPGAGGELGAPEQAEGPAAGEDMAPPHRRRETTVGRLHDQLSGNLEKEDEARERGATSEGAPAAV